MMRSGLIYGFTLCTRCNQRLSGVDVPDIELLRAEKAKLAAVNAELLAAVDGLIAAEDMRRRGDLGWSTALGAAYDEARDIQHHKPKGNR